MKLASDVVATPALGSPRETPGQLPQDVYATILPWWRSSIRSMILKAVERESPFLAEMQRRLRTPWLDTYFLYTSSLGTHTFFMIALPVLFFFGYSELGLGLIFVLGSGVYFSSFIKDLVCSPRPFSPPVTRLTIGTHHLEYGFPSTHSTNSVSMALFVFGHVHRAYAEHSAMSAVSYYVSCAVLVVYIISIVFGRLYTGVALGAGIWVAYIKMSDALEQWLASVPYIVTPMCLLLVHFHPQPVDDCPCFEDAIAFVSVILGASIARWHAAFSGVDRQLLQTVMPGGRGDVWTLGEKLRWYSLASAKVGMGILIIFVWRLLAKAVLHLVLPPLFRALAHCFDLPHRRFYTPATDYAHFPVENGLHPIPSVIDLSSTSEISSENVKYGVKRRGRGAKSNTRGNGAVLPAGTFPAQEKELETGKSSPQSGTEVKHYDADVLTKVVVYSGIAFLSAEGIPVLFSLMGWGIKP
ncbi:hypothetical protein V8B97DRAFT_1918710 [Scleroderma yunnanense]